MLLKCGIDKIQNYSSLLLKCGVEKLMLLKCGIEKFKITVYVPQKYKLYTKWNSLCPLKYKRNLVQCLLSRAYRICSNWPNIHNEFETITNMLLKNG